ncbi:MAG: nonstructural protein [Microviridae sp.]|nr:MAG: nonstructural protein [Microviridae sp.]
MKVFAVRDVCVGSFLMPMFFVNSAGATRALGDAVNKSGEDNQFYQHPEHFQLYAIGEFSEESGVITAFPAPEFVVDCQSLVRS